MRRGLSRRSSRSARSPWRLSCGPAAATSSAARSRSARCSPSSTTRSASSAAARNFQQVHHAAIGARGGGENRALMWNAGHHREPGRSRRPPDARGGAVVFEHVNFDYRKGEPVLRDLSFTVEPGQQIAIVGPTGSGKTTIMKLLNRFYDVTSGRILVDGVDVREWDLHGAAARDRAGAAGRFSLRRRHHGQCAARARGPWRGRSSPGARARAGAATSSSGCRPASHRNQRARRESLLRAAPTFLVCPRARLRSEDSGDGRSDLQRRQRDRAPDPDRAQRSARRIAPRWSSPIASPPSSAPTGSWCWPGRAARKRHPRGTAQAAADSTIGSSSCSTRPRQEPAREAVD